MTLDVHRKQVVSVGNYYFTGNILGKGNFARVEEAIHNILNVKVAIKIIDVNHIKEEYVIKNLYREAHIMSKLNHPCIVGLFQSMQRSDNVYYLVTEIANGGDLCAFVKKQFHGRLGEKQTKIYASQFCSALAHMHNLKVVHRDLKMENVMLNSVQTQIKIVDFGLSNFWDPENPLRTHCGSPEYAAPELFVTGRKYGTEVDLWSYGIILYGMVIGQLPFVTNRSIKLPSQERRKQLVAQINKGLSTPHRKALSSFTSEFRSLMNRLLMSDSTQRITTKELLSHPWITDKGKRMIIVNPLKNLDSIEKSKLITKISNVLQVEPKLVSSAVTQEVLGKVGGMFNILKRRYQLSQIHGDGSSRTRPSLTLFELSNATKSLEKDSNTKDPSLKMLQAARHKPHSAQTQTKKSDFSPRITASAGKHLKQSNSLTLEQEKIVSIKPKKRVSNKIRPSTVKGFYSQDQAFREVNDTIRPSTVQPIVQQKNPHVDYRSIQSPSLRRKVYSATITRKTNSPVVIKTEEKFASFAKQNDKKDVLLVAEKPKENFGFSFIKAFKKNCAYAQKFSKPITGKNKEIKTKESGNFIKLKEKEGTTKIEHKGSSDTKNNKKILLECPSHAIKPSTLLKSNLANKDVSFRPPESNPENIRSKSQQAERRRSIAGSLHQILEKSLQTAGHSRKSPRKYPGTSGASRSDRNKNESGKPEGRLEQSSMAYGDYAVRAATSSGHTRKLAIHDPIARSIADYVTNNASNKIYNYPWLKK